MNKNITFIISAFILAGGMVFLGMSLRMQNTAPQQQLSFEEQLEAYQKKQEEKQEQAQIAQQQQRERMAKNVAPITDQDHVRGNRNAEITLFEYSDFECPFCKRFSQTPEDIVKSNSGKVNAVYRHFPLNFHDPLATRQAIASECAAEQGGTDAFYKMHDAIFATTKSNGKGMKESQLSELAGKIGLNVATFAQCMDSGRYDAHVKENIESGVRAGVEGTPGVIIKNNKTGEVRVMPGAVPTESVQAAIDDLLAS